MQIPKVIKIIKKKYQFPTKTTLKVLGELIMSCSQIVLFFRDQLQLWDFSKFEVQKKKVFQSPSILYWTIPVRISPTQFVFISVEEDNKLLQVYDHTEKVQTLCNQLPDLRNFNQLHYLSETKCIGININGQQHMFLIYCLKERKIISEVVLNSNTQVQKYNNKCFVYIVNSAENNYFQIGESPQKVRHEITLIPGKIIFVQQFNETEALVCVVHNNISCVFIYSLKQNRQLQNQTIYFGIDNIIKISGKYIVIKTNQVYGSSLEVRQIFSNTMKSIEIQRWIRVLNDFLPIVTLSNKKSRKQICQIEVVKYISNQKQYVHLLEKSGLVKMFGKEIVKHLNRII